MAIGVGLPIESSDYNTLRTKINNILGPVATGYGYTGSDPSLPVIAGNPVLAAEWLKLHDELNRCIVHQTNAAISLPVGVTLPAVTGEIKANFVQYLDSLATVAQTNRTTLAAGQTASSSDNASSTRSTAWGSPITHQITYTWTNSDAARYFFNLGGRIELSTTWANSTGSGADLAWINLLTTANGIFDDTGKYYNTLNYESPSGTLTYTAASSGGNTIVVTFTRPALTQVVATVVFTPASTVDLDLTCTGTYYYSRGDLGGVGAQQPSAQVTLSLATGGAVPPPVFVPSRILNIPTSISSYSYTAGQTSAAQTITLENNGNSVLTISDITFTGNNGVIAIPVYSWGAIPTTTINSGTSKTFTLAYGGTIAGTFNNSFTVTSDNDTGPVSRTTTQVVAAVPAPSFDFSLSPSTWAVTANDRTVRNQFFAINPVNGSYSSYTASLSGHAAFNINNTDPSGPRVTFNPGVLGNSVYSTTLTVVVNGVTRTASIAVTLSAPTNQNIGSWLSPQAEYNSVIGMSYDFIGGNRYLTIGIGMAADGSNDLESGGGTNISLTNLGVNADTKYTDGVALYPALGGAGYTSFLTNYGVWVRPFTGGVSPPVGPEIERSYKINVTTAGNYDWEFGVDDVGYFDIDGVLCGDFRDVGIGWNSVRTGTIFLSAGVHILTFRIINADGPGSVAIRLRNSSTLAELWTTLTPVRATSPYQYWAEVYRIPLISGAATYYSYDYKVKDWSLVDGTGYGDRFGTAGTSTTRSMFTVDDDGAGNLSIAMNSFTNPSGNTNYDTTMANLSYSFYYYESLGSIVRYTQLGGPTGDGSQTEQFLGFNANGSVRTSLVTYPGYGVGTGSGPGGGFGYNPNIGGGYYLRWDPFLEEWVWEWEYRVGNVIE